MTDVDRPVFEHRNSGVRQGLSHALAVIPPVVIAQHGVDAQRSVQLVQLRGGLFGLDEVASGKPAAAPSRTTNDEIAQQYDQRGVFGVGALDDLPQLVEPHVRRADMQVTDHRDPQIGSPPRKFHGEMADHQQAGLDPESPQGD